MFKSVFLSFNRARAVSIARARTPGIFTTLIPATALRHIQRLFAGQGNSIKDLSLGAAKLVGILAKEACEKELAISGMRKDRMSLQQARWPIGLLARASEAFNGFEAISVTVSDTLPGIRTELCLPHTGSDGNIKEQGVHTGHFMGGPLVTEVEFLAFVGVFVVKDTVGPRAPGVNVSLGFLDKFTLATVHSVGKDASLLVPVGVVKEEAVVAQLGSGYVVFADIVEVTLLGVSKEAVGLRAHEIE